MARTRKASGRKKRESRGQANKIIYIFCEGEKTEPLYFKGLTNKNRLKNVTLKIEGTGYHTQSLVNKAEEQMKNISYDEVWIVMDKDNFPDFNDAIKSAKSKGFKVAYSNECFELWYLLHFFRSAFQVGRNGQDGYYSLLTKILNEKCNANIQSYRQQGKNIKDIYYHLEPYKDTAIQNAQWLEAQNKKSNTHRSIKAKPSTAVHHLVKSLLNHSE